MKNVSNRPLSLLIAICISTAFAGTQGASAQDGKSSYAVLNVGRVFKADSQFQDEMKELHAAAEKLKVDAKAAAEKLRGAKAHEIEQAKTSGRQPQSPVAVIKQRESKLYSDTYDRMQEAVSELCETHGINLVLRMDQQPVDDSPRSVIQRVNKKVVFHRQLDLTNLVIQQMKNPSKKKKVVVTPADWAKTPNFCDKCGHHLSHHDEAKAEE